MRTGGGSFEVVGFDEGFRLSRGVDHPEDPDTTLDWRVMDEIIAESGDEAAADCAEIVTGRFERLAHPGHGGDLAERLLGVFEEPIRGFLVGLSDQDED